MNFRAAFFVLILAISPLFAFGQDLFDQRRAESAENSQQAYAAQCAAAIQQSNQFLMDRVQAIGAKHGGASIESEDTYNQYIKSIHFRTGDGSGCSVSDEYIGYECYDAQGKWFGDSESHPSFDANNCTIFYPKSVRKPALPKSRKATRHKRA